MKPFHKRSAISLVVLAMAGCSYASEAHHSYSQNTMWWPPHFTGFFLGAEGLDLRPQNGDLDYVAISPSITGAPFIIDSITTSYNWGWRFYGGIQFTDCDDITASWFHFNNSYHASVDPIDPSSGIRYFPRWLPILDPDSWTDGVRAKVTFDVDEAYVVWGHTIHFNNPWTLRYAAGVEYARIKSNLTIAAIGPQPEDNDEGLTQPRLVQEFGYVSESDTRGWGPRLEVDASYRLPCDLSWFIRTNVVLLASTREISTDVINSDVTLPLIATESDFETRHVVIPKLGIKLGLSYDMMFGQSGCEGGCGNVFTLEAGWQADAYIHAIERPDTQYYDFLVETPRLVGLPQEFDSTKVSNFTDQGWFVGAKISL